MADDALYVQPFGIGRLGELLQGTNLVVFDFDGVFTDNTVWLNQDGVESVRCCRSDGIGLSRLRALDIPAVIVSTEVNPVVSKRAEKLRLPCRQGVRDKAKAFRAVCDERNIALENAAFVGNDINDIPAFKLAGIPIAVADCYEEVLPFVVYRTRRAGGMGAVREVCDLIFSSRQYAGHG